MNYLLTKTKLMAGLQCRKKLWFDVNEPIKQESHLFYIGNRFGEFARNHYGTGLNLAGISNAKLAINQTNKALTDLLTSSIYEAAFLHSDTLVRPDVLLRRGDAWEMVEIKASTSLKDEHIRDASIQAYVLRSCELPINKIKIGHINNEFVYRGNGIYSGLLIEVDITEQVNELIPKVQNWIEELKYLGAKGAQKPNISVSEHCSIPYPCSYIERCRASIPKLAEIPISIIPNVGKKLAKDWAAKEIYDLRDLPSEVLKHPIHKIIQKSHIHNSPWINPQTKKRIEGFSWPRFFMDFETVQQGVPIILDTKPYQPLPFQWSLHKWENQDQQLKLQDGEGFLEFNNPDMARLFLSGLINSLGNTGPIFVHNASFEKTVLKSLIQREDCIDLNDLVEKIIERIVDTLELVRDGFYSPEMRGSYSLKDIVKAIPTSVNYEDKNSLSSGSEAQIAWFKCTDISVTEDEKQVLSKRLKHYCAQDTYALYDLLKYLAK